MSPYSESPGGVGDVAGGGTRATVSNATHCADCLNAETIGRSSRVSSRRVPRYGFTIARATGSLKLQGAVSSCSPLSGGFGV